MSYAGLHYFRYDMLVVEERKIGTLRLGSVVVYSLDVTHIPNDDEAEIVVVNSFAEVLQAVSKLPL